MSHKFPKAMPAAGCAYASSKSQTTQQTTDLQPESLEVDDLSAQQPVSHASQISPISNTPNPIAHAAMINRAVASPQSSQQVILQLQRQYGNRYVNRVLQQAQQLQTPIQAKLTLGAVGDKYEQEADAVAKQVVNQIQTSQLATTTQTPSVQRDMMAQENKLQMKPADTIQREGVLDEENELGMNALLQRSATADGSAIAAPNLETSIQEAKGRGQPLPDNIRQPMEQAFGANFSGVKIHTDLQSDRLNQAVQAKAFTTGQDIFFRQGKYNPGSSIGQELLAHELTHVVQQTQRQILSIQRAEDEDKGEKEKQIQELSTEEILELINIFLEDIERPTNLENTQDRELNTEEILESISTLFEDIEHPVNREDTQAQELSIEEILKLINIFLKDIEPPTNLEDTQAQELSIEEILKSIYTLFEDIEYPVNREDTKAQELRSEQLTDSSTTELDTSINHNQQKQLPNLSDKSNAQKELPEEVSDINYHLANTIGGVGSVLALDTGILTTLGEGTGVDRALKSAPNIASNSLGIVGALGTGLISGAFEAASAHKALKEGRKAEAIAYGIQSGGDLASGALGIASGGLSLASHVAATAVGSGASGAGAIFGTIEALRYGVNAHRSKKAKDKLEKIANSEIASPTIKEVATYAAKIQQKARTRQALYATGGALQMAGGVITAATGGTGIGAAVGLGVGLSGAAVKPVLTVTRFLKQKGHNYAANHQDTKLGQTFGEIFDKEKSTKNKDQEREKIANLLMNNHQDSDMQEILKNLPQVNEAEMSQYQKGEMTQEDLIAILKRREETLKLKVPNALKFSRKPKLPLANSSQ